MHSTLVKALLLFGALQVASAAPAPLTAETSPNLKRANVLLSSVAGQPHDATFYYDINGGGTCGPVNGINSFAGIDAGFTFCEPSNVSKAKTLGQRGTNNIVAMPANLLSGNAAKYCGKKVIVTWNGVQRTDLDLFIWDACQACSGNDGLDFSSTIFGNLAGAANCAAGRIENKMTWEIVDETVLAYTP